MANKTFNTRVKNKRDTAANWEAVATTFQPLDGELIIVDTAAGKTRFKVGRYDTAKGRLLYYNEIPFTDEYLYNDLNESQGKIYDKLKGIDDKSIIEMTLEPSYGNGATELYKVGLWQFPQSGFYKIKFSVLATSATLFQVFARETGEDGTTNEDFSISQLKIYDGLGGDAQTPYVFVLADYLDNDSFTSYHVQFLNLGTNLGRIYINTYDKSTQKWSYGCQKVVEANKVGNALTLTKGDATTKFDGSTAQTVSIPTKTSELTNDSFVSYAEQTLTEDQQNQAKTNLGIDVLTGNTTTVTPTQVKEAILAGRPVAITYVDDTYGNLTFTSFGYSLENNVIVANLISIYNTRYILADLVGMSSNDQWHLQTTELGTPTDIANNYVKYSESQNLTDAQKATARTNIGAISSSDLVQSDWNQNDETAKDYIKNRICYTKDATEIIVLNSTLSFTDISQQDKTVFSYQNTSSSIKFNEGTVYNVNFDSISYSCIAFTNTNIPNCVILGNLGVVSELSSATNEPFVMVTDSKGSQGLQILTNLTGTSHSVKITEIHTEIIKLDKKYIPDDIFTSIENIDNKVEDFINNTQFLTKTDSVGTGSFSFNRETGSTVGENSATFGLNNIASGNNAFAEGAINKATGWNSHAEGNATTASGNAAHAEGYETIAAGGYSHSEGYKTRAMGTFTHTEGEGTIASSANQHVQGRYNIEDSNSKYLHIVGNGNSNTNRSNAHTVDKNGNGWFAGTIEGTALILKSSTPNSTKRFRITVDDSGTISATAIN